jgi:hypothetical protein
VCGSESYQCCEEICFAGAAISKYRGLPPTHTLNTRVIIDATGGLSWVNLMSYKTVVLLVVLYGFETWSLTLRDENRLRVFENRVLRRIFGPKK